TLHAAFVDVAVPTAAVDEQHFHTDVGFQELADLLQALAEAAGGILRAVLGAVLGRIDFAKHLYGFKGFGTGPVPRAVDGLGVQGLEAAWNRRGAGRRLWHHLELLEIRQSDRRRAAVKHARKTWPHGDRAKRRGVLLGNGFDGAIEPAVFGGLYPRGAGLHEVLCVE